MPKGAECDAVRRGVRSQKVTIEPIPMGMAAVADYLQERSLEGDVLLAGLCGSLCDRHPVGTILLYEGCISRSTGEFLGCDRALTECLRQKLGGEVSCVRGLTSDRFVASGDEKRQLAARYDAEAADMEGFAFLKSLQSPRGRARVAMLRAVGDDCAGDVPDLSVAIAPDGSLRAGALAACFARQPVAAARLVGGSLRGLRSLRRAVEKIAGGECQS